MNCQKYLCTHMSVVPSHFSLSSPSTLLSQCRIASPPRAMTNVVVAATASTEEDDTAWEHAIAVAVKNAPFSTPKALTLLMAT